MIFREEQVDVMTYHWFEGGEGGNGDDDDDVTEPAVTANRSRPIDDKVSLRKLEDVRCCSST